MKTTMLMAILAAGLLVAPVRAQAQAQAQDAAPDDSAANTTIFGFRAGYTSWNGVHQPHWGAHLKLGEVFPNIQFTPSLEFGFGDNTTIFTANGDLAYGFTELVAYPWNVYGGGSLSFNTFNPKGSSVQTDLGLSAIAGLERTFSDGNQGLVELRFGIMDSPSFKLTFGYTIF